MPYVASAGLWASSRLAGGTDQAWRGAEWIGAPKKTKGSAGTLAPGLWFRQGFSLPAVEASAALAAVATLYVAHAWAASSWLDGNA